MTEPKVLERIRKLLALSASPNKHEAATALSHARRLMKKHGLSDADVTDASQDGTMFELSMGASGFSARWKFVLVAAVSQAFFCDVVGLRVGKRRKVRIVGLKEDTDIAAQIFQYLLDEIERLVRVERRNPPNELLIDVILDVNRDLRSYLDSFRRGAVSATIEKLRQSKKSTDSSDSHPHSRSLVVAKPKRIEVKEYIKTKFASSRYFSLEGSKGEIDDLGFVRGYDAALVSIAIPSQKGTDDGKERTL